jgi:hypothetical protein
VRYLSATEPEILNPEAPSVTSANALFSIQVLLMTLFSLALAESLEASYPA